MPAAWVAAGGAVLGALGGGSGGGGTQTATKEPWAAAVPWLTANLQTGQDLQKFYQDNPFNPLQQAAYGNLIRGNDYVNAMVPGLLSQFSQPTGFDRSNPRARPAPMMFPAMGTGPTGAMQDLSGVLGPSLMQARPWAGPLAQSAPRAAPQVSMPSWWSQGSAPDGA